MPLTTGLQPVRHLKLEVSRTGSQRPAHLGLLGAGFSSLTSVRRLSRRLVQGSARAFRRVPSLLFVESWQSGPLCLLTEDLAEKYLHLVPRPGSSLRVVANAIQPRRMRPVGVGI